jgi:hypothetical protein
MDNGLQDVISAAVGAGRKVAKEPARRRVPQLSIVETGRSDAPATPAAAKVSSAAAFRTVPNETTPRNPAPAAGAHLGQGGLRLAFWVCGFHEALMERRRQGQQLTEKEEFLLALSPKDFAGIRPLVVDMTLARFDAVMNSPALPADVEDLQNTHPMEVFALTTLRNLSRRARQALDAEGPDAALALFGQSTEVMEPLAIFQLVFMTALDLVESFERLIPAEASLLARLAEALDSEVDRI